MTTRQQGAMVGRWWIVAGLAGVVVWAYSTGSMAAEEASKDAPVQQAPAAQETVVIQDGMDVAMDYTLTVDGAVVDSSEGKGPFRYQHGAKQIIPGLERALVGLKVGDSKEVTVSQEDGYGAYEAARVIEVPKAQMPSDMGVEVGMMLGGMDASGRPIRGIVKEIKDKSVTMDLNHPLAGKTLHFKVTINEIKPKG